MGLVVFDYMVAEFYKISLRKHLQLKQFVYALFTQLYKKSSYDVRNCFIISVDQIGLEPMTSRLWVCCSNQLSYKSDLTAWDKFATAKVRIFERIRKFFLVKFNILVFYAWRVPAVRWRIVLIYSVLQNGLFRALKRAESRCETGRFVLRNGPFRKWVRMQW